MTIFNFEVPKSGFYTFEGKIKTDSETKLREDFTFEDAIEYVESSLKKGIRKT